MYGIRHTDVMTNSNKVEKADSFSAFLEIWNTLQGYETPLIHYKMATWLQESYESGEKQLLLMAFRASGKSTIVGLFSAWVLLQDQDLRILVLAAESSLANKMVRNIRKIIERHPSTVELIPNKGDQWASDRFTILREKELRDASILGNGVTANVTGSRADIIIYDDVEVPNTCGNPDKRLSLRERLMESNFILSPDGIQLYVGTPHTYFSIYAKEARYEIGEDDIFLAGFKRYEQAVLDCQNKTVWPEIFSDERIQRLKQQSGPNKFASQMMLQPTNILDSRLDPQLLNFYQDDLNAREAQNHIHLSLCEQKIISCNAWWDPAFGSEKGDNSVFAIIYTDEDGFYYLHHIEYIKIPKGADKDEASLQCEIVANLAKEFFVPSVTIETNGIGNFLPSILRREMANINLACSVLGKANKKNKNDRILESFDVVLAARMLNVHKNVKSTPFITEMSEWQPALKSNRDDGLDAVAGALSCEPVRIKRSNITTNRKWFGGNKIFRADTDFKI